MSDNLFTNIDDLETLVAQCEATGQRILQGSAEYQGDIATAIGEFQSSMSTLRTEVQAFETEMGSELTRLRARADSVHWEGNAYRAFISDVGTFQQATNTAAAQIREAINAVATAVATTFSDSLEQAGQENQRAATMLDESSATLATETANVRSGVEAVDHWGGQL